MFHTKFILFAAVALMAVSCANAIIGGQDATRGQFPYFAFLDTYRVKTKDFLIFEKSKTFYGRCGGAIVSSHWIVTAAQCLATTDGAEVHLGVYRLYGKVEEERQWFNVTKDDYFFYPSYNKDKPFVNDIAMVKLPSAIAFSRNVFSILLPSEPTNLDEDVFTMGYGFVKPDVFPQNLQHIKMKTIGLKQCNIKNSISKSSVVCASGNAVSICNGDVGGPLVSLRSGKLVGIAISTYKNCETGYPQGFTGIYAYTEWIDGVIEGVIRKN